MQFFSSQDDRQTSLSGPLNWHCEPFDALSTHTLYQIMKARVDVFVVEQTCPYPEMDDQDQTALHLQCYSNGGLAAYARILPPDGEGHVYIGRILTVGWSRGHGIGKALLEKAIGLAAEAYPGVELRLGAQARLQAFYEQFGFVVCGDSYLEDDIPHIPMQRLPA